MIQNLFGDDDGQVHDSEPTRSAGGLSILDSGPDTDSESGEKEPFILSDAEPESFAETARRSGLAWSAGIVFFASITFMLVIGWGADLLLGSSPWGLVGGILVGSLIGFIQFFRLTSQIFKK